MNPEQPAQQESRQGFSSREIVQSNHALIQEVIEKLGANESWGGNAGNIQTDEGSYPAWGALAFVDRVTGKIDHFDLQPSSPKEAQDTFGTALVRFYSNALELVNEKEAIAWTRIAGWDTQNIGRMARAVLKKTFTEWNEKQGLFKKEAGSK
ncbi:MAG: hypothetical protein U0517_03930 [Candidatus Andersenbacteria bacterium]